jgi:hypothetical protein
LAKKKRSPLRKSPSPGKTVPPNVDSPTIDPETFMVVAKTPDLVAPHVDAEPQRTPKYIDLEPDYPSSQNEGGFMAEVPPPSPSMPYFDLTGDDAPLASHFVTSAAVPYFTTTKPKRSID